MRVMVAGKGGVGKTTVSSVLARSMRAAGWEVVAVDADGSPNLSLALGVGHPDELPAVANQTPPSPDDSCDTPPLIADDVLEEFAIESVDGIWLVQTGRIERPSERCLCCGSHATARRVMAALRPEPGAVVVADLEPGLNDLLWIYPRPGDTLVLVTDESARSVEVARRMASIASQLGVERIAYVANKVKDGDQPPVYDIAEPESIVEVPYQEDLEGQTPDGESPSEVKRLLEMLGALVPV